MQPAVLIVGAGPVGMTMAAELTRFGVPVRIIDKAPQRTDKSKALVLWSRTLELMDRGGYSRAFLEAGFRVTAANFYGGGRHIARLPLDDVPTPHPYALMLPQCDTERLLEEQLRSWGVVVERPVELTEFVPGAEHVTATLRHPDGRGETLDVSWLIGCDGAHSTIRHGLGIPFSGSTMPSDWILADVHLHGAFEHGEEVNIFWHADGVLVSFPISPGRFRVIADVGDGHTNPHPPAPTLEAVQALVDRRGPGGLVVSEPVWLSAFRINERKVADYRAGRVFMAGDAAHVHSPAGGQGMNTGMQDAFNLAWKLALVERGLAATEPLLGSYSVERGAVGEQVLADAGRLTMVATLRSGVLQGIRNHVAGVVFGFAGVREKLATKLTELGIGYPHSPLTVSGGRHQHGPAAGDRAPVEKAGAVTADVFGAAPRFVVYGERSVAGAAVMERYGDVVDQTVREPFVEGGMWLVRPDGYVAIATARGDWSAIESYLARLKTPVVQ
ncbi:FAD-dependent monooxygenase [Planctomyces sp. SH-PL14]|uniref:FAD-dependent monooxygenase n=1 Tax=Planctomyces sp. SH-PL14 TaxID=1632864 RepID=UPI00078E53F6|nr:FAD-dependent monooxygenase [Planctomyces sp. SH-PL14]AMV20636.1 Pentachlorophenol 4-monooxygenase [Planctomyces sp. SH-PL14]